MNVINLSDYGLSDEYKEISDKEKKENETLGRVVAQYSNFSKTVCEDGAFLSELSGKLQKKSVMKKNLPVIGDWVLISKGQNSEYAVINRVLQRKSYFARKRRESETEAQIIAANIDILGIVSALDSTYNRAKIERFITLAHEGNVKPLLIFNKTDIAENLEKRKEEIGNDFKTTEKIYISAKLNEGFEEINKHLKGKTSIAFVGSSGVGKSSILNRLLGKEKMRTKNVRDKDDKGRHTTTHKELTLLKSGAIVIDTPGLRELGLTGDEYGIDQTFSDIKKIAQNCKFRDCKHIKEPGCAVKEALEANTISMERYESYIKQRKEAEEEGDKRLSPTSFAKRRRKKYF